MAGKPKFTAAEVSKALKKARGLVSLAAQMLKCDPETVRNYIKRYPTVREAFENAREVQIDRVEAKLFTEIEAGNTACILFYLKCQAKHRGYVEKVVVGGDEDAPPVQHEHSHNVNVSFDELADFILQNERS